MGVRKKIDEWLDERDKKGIKTYGQSIDDCPTEDYNWDKMLIEELLDGLQYAAKENERLEKENKQLRERLDD